MDLIYTDKNYKEIGYLKKCEVDFDLGSFINSSSTNDFQITLPIDNIPKEIDEGSLIYEVGTEIGGIVNGIGADTSLGKAYIYGITWRGMLQNKNIIPLPNQAYYIVKGDANIVIKELIDNQFDGLIVGTSELSNIEVNRNFRFTQLGEGIERMLADNFAKIRIKSAIIEDRIKVIISAIYQNNFTNEIELNNDYGISLTAKKIKNGINHLICLGKGELTERTVIHLYKLKDGTITTDSEYSLQGLDERTLVYDFSSAETEEELINGGKKKFEENADEETLSIKIIEDVDIGDIVSARERITAIYMQKQVTQKIVKGYIDKVKIDYKVGD